MNTKNVFYSALIFSPVLLLSGCNWFSSEKTEKAPGALNTNVTSGEWVVKIGNEIAVTPQQLQEEFNLLLEEKPQLKAMLPLMPNLEQDVAKSLGSGKVIARYIKDNKIDQKLDYIAKRDRFLRTADQMLNLEFFKEEFPVKQLSDADAKKFYEENRDSMQGALISKGGVTVYGVSFDKKDDADAFFNKVKGIKNLDLKKVAQENKLGDNFKDFNMVNAQSFGIEAVLRTKILAMKKFPKVEILPIGDKTFWVVHATGKKDPQYRSFDEVKDGVKNVAQQTEQVKQLQNELEKLMKKYDVQVNEDYFRSKALKENAKAAAFKALEEKDVVAQNEDVESEPLSAAKTV